MKITLNGHETELSDGLSVLGLVLFLELEPKNVAVERNMEIVPKSLHDDTVLVEGDAIEIVEFVGGG